MSEQCFERETLKLERSAGDPDVAIATIVDTGYCGFFKNETLFVISFYSF